MNELKIWRRFYLSIFNTNAMSAIVVAENAEEAQFFADESMKRLRPYWINKWVAYPLGKGQVLSL